MEIDIIDRIFWVIVKNLVRSSTSWEILNGVSFSLGGIPKNLPETYEAIQGIQEVRFNAAINLFLFKFVRLIPYFFPKKLVQWIWKFTTRLWAMLVQDDEITRLCRA